MTQVQRFIISILLVTLGISIGYSYGKKGYQFDLLSQKREIEIDNKTDVVENNVDFKKFWEIFDLVNNRHIKKPLDLEKLRDGAIKGMVESVGDPYSIYLDVEEKELSDSVLNGSYEGIGAELDLNEQGILIVVSPLDNSPAAKAGLLPADMIIEIDGKSSLDYTVEKAVKEIRGPKGEKVVLTVAREGETEPKDIEIIRDQIILESVTWKKENDDVIYIRLARFGEDTFTEWQKVMEEIKPELPNARGVILDVRNNPGGLLTAAVNISSEFLPKGKIVTTEVYSNGTSNKLVSTRAGLFDNFDKPIIVMVNKGSASASEIVASAIKEGANGIILGQRSFGKGTVQEVLKFKDGTALNLSVAKWVTPNGNWLDKINSEYEDSKYNETVEEEKIIGGIKPDVPVESILQTDGEEEQDEQLNAAIEKIYQN